LAAEEKEKPPSKKLRINCATNGTESKNVHITTHPQEQMSNATTNAQ